MSETQRYIMIAKKGDRSYLTTGTSFFECQHALQQAMTEISGGSITQDIRDAVAKAQYVTLSDCEVRMFETSEGMFESVTMRFDNHETKDMFA